LIILNYISAGGREQEEPQPKMASLVAGATDSGIIEDTSSYLEPSGIPLRESEFQQSDGSLMEGSVVDTDYADRMATKTAAERWRDAELGTERTSCCEVDAGDEVKRRDRAGRRRV